MIFVLTIKPIFQLYQIKEKPQSEKSDSSIGTIEEIKP
jgi:hypothetical protein